MARVLQWVAPRGVDSNVFVINASILTAVTVRGAPGRGSSRDASNDVLCWGSNFYGQIGDGTTINRLMPADVMGITDAVEVRVGGDSTCARRLSGAVVCWGRNHSGQLGDGTLPVLVAGLTNVVEISAGHFHTCARGADGSVSCWGHDDNGALGDAMGFEPAKVIGIP